MTMLKNKDIAFSLILVCLLLVSPTANGIFDLVSDLLGGLLGGCQPGGRGVGSLRLASGGKGGLLNLANIRGVLVCTANGPLSSTLAPTFAHASVELQCGKDKTTMVSKSTTNADGLFSFRSTDIQMELSTLLSDCKLVVPTPLSTCNATLPSDGNLVSQLTVTGSILSGVLNIINVIPSGFRLTN